MRLVDILLGSLGGVGLVGLSGWSYLQFPGLAKSYEASLLSNAEAALAQNGLDWVSVSLDGQSAQLSGPSSAAEAETRAVAVVLASSGQGGPFWGGITDVSADFSRLAVASPFVWRASRTPDGQIILTGNVPGAEIQSDLAGLATGLAAEAGIEDRTEIAAGAPEGDWLGATELALSAIAELDSGSAKLEDTRLSVSGIAMDNARRARLSAQVASVASPFEGHPDIRGPSLWSARHADGALLLEGQVASLAERDEILQIASDHFAGNVIDDMQVAGDPNRGWLDGVRRGLPHFAQFRSGWFGFDPAGDGFTIAGSAPGSVLAYLREDMAVLTGPYAVSLEGREVAVEVAELDAVDLTGDARSDCEAQFAAVLARNFVEFASGNAEISRASGQTLDKLMAVAGRCAPGLVFELGGHTDSLGERAFNVYLGEIRAQAVADYMVASGFDADRLCVIGYGPDQPKADNASPEGRAMNRRIEFKVLEQTEQ